MQESESGAWRRKSKHFWLGRNPGPSRPTLAAYPMYQHEVPLGRKLRLNPKFSKRGSLHADDGTEEDVHGGALLTFGKHEGRSFDDIYENEVAYVLWFADHMAYKTDLSQNRKAFRAYITSMAALGATPVPDARAPTTAHGVSAASGFGVDDAHAKGDSVAMRPALAERVAILEAKVESMAMMCA